jgi:hypothetical protein
MEQTFQVGWQVPEEQLNTPHMYTIPKSSEDEQQHFCMSTRNSINKHT